MSSADTPNTSHEPAYHTEQAATAMLAAVAVADRGGQDFAEWLSQVLARVAAMSGGVEALLAGRTGSWESGVVRDFVRATVGDDQGLVEHLPEGFRPPLGSVALHESADGTLWLVIRPWDGSEEQLATVYVRGAALHPDEDLYNDVHGWLIDGGDPAEGFRWRELGAGDVAKALAHQAHAGADLYDGQAAPGVLLGTFYRDRANLGAREDGGLYFDIADRDYLHSRPLAVQRYCQTDHAASLQDEEEQAADAVVAELAELAGELTAADRAAGVLSRSPQEQDQVAVLYATALALARDDDAAFDRARELKAEYEAWWLRWHGLYADAHLPASTYSACRRPPPPAPTRRTATSDGQRYLERGRGRAALMAHLLGYARVSTVLQDEALQTDALDAAGVVRIYTDKVSSRLERRPQLDALLERADAGDTIVVWRLDRLARSLRELIDLVNNLGHRGVGLRSLTEQIDTTTAAGRLLFHLMSSIAEFERDLLQERTQAGLAAARARGRRGGRPTVMTPDKIRTPRELYDRRDMTVAAIAKTLGVSRATVYAHLAPAHGHASGSEEHGSGHDQNDS